MGFRGGRGGGGGSSGGRDGGGGGGGGGRRTNYRVLVSGKKHVPFFFITFMRTIM